MPVSPPPPTPSTQLFPVSCQPGKTSPHARVKYAHTHSLGSVLFHTDWSRSAQSPGLSPPLRPGGSVQVQSVGSSEVPQANEVMKLPCVCLFVCVVHFDDERAAGPDWIERESKGFQGHSFVKYSFFACVRHFSSAGTTLPLAPAPSSSPKWREAGVTGLSACLTSTHPLLLILLPLSTAATNVNFIR